MLNNTQLGILVSDFPELGNKDIILQKEMYAHFGLLFYRFSLVETSMSNTLGFFHLGNQLKKGKIKSEKDWQHEHDTGFANAAKQTFGNLLQKILKIKGFSEFESELRSVKEKRDYFAHHFFREEAYNYANDEGCWHLIWEMVNLGNELVALDESLRVPFEAMLIRFNLPSPTKDEMTDTITELEKERDNNLRTHSPEFGWIKK